MLGGGDLGKRCEVVDGSEDEQTATPSAAHRLDHIPDLRT
jgi:hypothetical protein